MDNYSIDSAIKLIQKKEMEMHIYLRSDDGTIRSIGTNHGWTNKQDAADYYNTRDQDDLPSIQVAMGWPHDHIEWRGVVGFGI